MSTFILAQVNIKDLDKFKTYSESVPDTLAPFDGEITLRGKLAGVFTGDNSHNMVAILKFPDQATAKNWYDSDAYQALIPNREQAADMVLSSYIEPPQ